MSVARRSLQRFTGTTFWVGGVIVVALLGFVSTGCTQLPTPIATLFDSTPPKPVVHTPRRPPYKAPVTFTVVEVHHIAETTDWPQRLEQLPKDASGGVDWVNALDAGLIKPRPGVADDAEELPELDMDVVLVPPAMPDFAATFPHKVHTRLLTCVNCHTSIFQMEKGADPITMEKIFAGEYCGRCHGKVAYDLATGCPRCHKAMPG